ncbi:MAG: response regulator [Anaerolineae bacterium]|nr:response regulator [Anaerolineae bacterium]
MTTTILVVDDSISIRKMIESALRFKGYTVAAVADGEEALEALSREKYGLVILDVNMPRMDGLTLLKTMRRSDEWAGVAVLMLTTEDRDEDRERALALGANAYMVKPFKPGELLDCIARLLPNAKP